MRLGLRRMRGDAERRWRCRASAACSQRESRQRSRVDLRGVDLATGRCRFALASSRRSSPVSAIHLASTSSESGSASCRTDACHLETRRNTRPAAGRSVARRRRSAGAGRSGRRTRPRRCAALDVRAPDADEAELAVHRPLLLAHAGTQQLARGLLGAPLTAGIERELRDDPAPSAVALPDLGRRAARRCPTAARSPPAPRRPEREPSAVPGSAPGSPGEEDHALRVTRNLCEGAHHHRLTAAVRLRQRDRRPQTSVELVAELRHQPPLILRKLDVPFRDENLAMTRFHPQKAHRPDYARCTPSVLATSWPCEAAFLTALGLLLASPWPSSWLRNDRGHLRALADAVQLERTLG